MSVHSSEAAVGQTIRNFVVENFLFGDGSRVNEKTSLLQAGIIDSTGILELIMFIESTYGISIEDHELVPANMDSILNVASFVVRKRTPPTEAHQTSAAVP